MSRRRDICVCARAYTVPPGRWRARSVRAETGHYGRTGQFRKKGLDGFAVSTEESSHRAADCHVEMWDGGDVPASLEKSNPCASRSSGTSSSASSCGGGEQDAKTFEAAESGGASDSARHSATFRARSHLVVAFVPSRMSRTPRPRGSRSRDDPSPTHLLVPRQQRRLVAVRGQGRVVPRSAPREGHLAVLAARPFSDDEVAVFTAENLAPISSVGGPRAARDVDAHARGFRKSRTRVQP
jgi:hypothetical protein